MNATHLVGRVGQKPELSNTRGGSPYCRFSLATDTFVKGKGEETIKRVTWLPLVIFGPAAVNLVSVLRQGSLVSVSGELTSRRVEDDALNSHTEVNVKVLSWQLLAHNHPSGDVRPSDEDIRFTRRLAEAGEVVGVQLVDSLILGRDGDGFRFFSILRRRAARISPHQLTPGAHPAPRIPKGEQS